MFAPERVSAPAPVLVKPELALASEMTEAMVRVRVLAASKMPSVIPRRSPDPYTQIAGAGTASLERNENS